MGSTEARSSTIYQPMKLPKCSSVRGRNKGKRKNPRSEETSDDIQPSMKNLTDEQRTSSEVVQISKLVGWKLEHYFGEKKKELSFNVNGRFRTTARLQKYDLMYKVAEIMASENNRKRKGLKKTGKGNKQAMKFKESTSSSTAKDDQLKQIISSRAKPFVLPSEAKRVVSQANGIWDADQLTKLALIQRYLPHTYMTEDELETTRVLTHSRHPYAVLHADHYVQYCKQNELYNGNPNSNPKLLKLRKKSSSKDGEATNPAPSSQSNSRSRSVPPAQKHQRKIPNDSTSDKKTPDQNQKSVQEKEAKHRMEKQADNSPRKERKEISNEKKTVIFVETENKGTNDKDKSDCEENKDDHVQDNDSYSDDFEDEENDESGGDNTSQSYVSLVHAEHAEKCD